MDSNKWNLKDTVYLEPKWNDLEFCRSLYGESDYSYEELKKSHEAILLKEGCELVAILVHPKLDDNCNEMKDRGTRASSHWYLTFEDAVDEVLSREHERLVEERDQLLGATVIIQHYRKQAEAAEAAGKKKP